MPNKTLFKASLLMGNGERASIQGRSIIDFESSEVQGLHCIEKQILNWGSNILLVENPKIEKVGDYCFLAHKNLAEKVRKSRHKNSRQKRENNKNNTILRQKHIDLCFFSFLFHTQHTEKFPSPS